MGNQCCELPYQRFDINEVKMLWPELATELIEFRDKYGSSYKSNDPNVPKSINQKSKDFKKGLQYKEIIASNFLFFGFVKDTAKTQKTTDSTKFNSESLSSFSSLSEVSNKQNRDSFTRSPAGHYSFQDFGILIERGHAYYIGFFKNGRFHGEGKQHCQKMQFEGVYQNGKKFSGRLTCPSYTYEGEFDSDGEMKGKAKIYFSNKDFYEGHSENGILSGKGKMKYANGDFYEGNFKENLFHGEGTYVWRDGTIYKGSYKRGIKHGFGILSQKGTVHKYCWVEGKAEGKPLDFKEYQLKKNRKAQNGQKSKKQIRFEENVSMCSIADNAKPPEKAQKKSVKKKVAKTTMCLP